jgi:hypothetical protein
MLVLPYPGPPAEYECAVCGVWCRSTADDWVLLIPSAEDVRRDWRMLRERLGETSPAYELKTTERRVSSSAVISTSQTICEAPT